MVGLSTNFTTAIQNVRADGRLSQGELQQILDTALSDDGAISSAESREINKLYSLASGSDYYQLKSFTDQYLRGKGLPALNYEADLESDAANDGTSAQVILDNISVIDAAAGTNLGDGFDKVELQKIINTPGLSESVKSAAQYILQGFDNFDVGAGGPPDGIVKPEDLATIIAGSKLTAQSTIKFLKDNFAAFDKDGNHAFNRTDLAQMLTDPSTSSQMKAVAKRLLEDPELYNRADGALSNGQLDGVITIDDINQLSQTDLSKPAAMNRESARGVLESNFDLFDKASDGSTDGLVGQDDFQALVGDPSTPADIKAAAQYYIDHPQDFDAMSKKNHVITLRDVQLDHFASNITDSAALGFLQANRKRFDGDNDGVISKKDVEGVANDNNAPLEAQATAKYLLAHPDFMTRLINANPNDAISYPDAFTFQDIADLAKSLGVQLPPPG